MRRSRCCCSSLPSFLRHGQNPFPIHFVGAPFHPLRPLALMSRVIRLASNQTVPISAKKLFRVSKGACRTLYACLRFRIPPESFPTHLVVAVAAASIAGPVVPADCRTRLAFAGVRNRTCCCLRATFLCCSSRACFLPRCCRPLRRRCVGRAGPMSHRHRLPPPTARGHHPQWARCAIPETVPPIGTS